MWRLIRLLVLTGVVRRILLRVWRQYRRQRV